MKMCSFAIAPLKRQKSLTDSQTKLFKATDLNFSDKHSVELICVNIGFFSESALLYDRLLFLHLIDGKCHSATALSSLS